VQLQHQQVAFAVAGTALMAVMLHCLIGSCLAQVPLSLPAAVAVAAAAAAQLLLLSQLSFAAVLPRHLLLLSTSSNSYQAMRLEALLLQLLLAALPQRQQAS
jgi:hypothetical protein